MKVGKVFEYLTVIEINQGTKDIRKCATVKCICGTVKQIQVNYLSKGLVKSCGCKKIEMMLTNKQKIITKTQRNCLRCERLFDSINGFRICYRCKLRKT
jgi:hypothetical protein